MLYKQISNKINNKINMITKKSFIPALVLIGSVLSLYLSLSPAALAGSVKTSNNNPFDKKVMVGYVQAETSTNNMIQEALAHKYNVIVFAFANVTGEQISVDNLNQLQQQVDMVKNSNAIALVSVGGQNISFNPTDSTNFAKLGKNIADFLTDNHLDGLDLDLEGVPASVTVDHLLEMLKALREQYLLNNNKAVIITGAPEVAGGYGSPASLGFALSIWSKRDFLEQANFDALFVQEYNQGGGAFFDGKQDTDVGFISASFGPLSSYIPTPTKIIVGEPATQQAGNGLHLASDIVTDLQSGSVLGSERFAGMMTWSINYDYNNNWKWVDGVSSVIL